jgi:Clr5 domain
MLTIMDFLEHSPFSAALPDAFTFVKPNPLIEQPPQNPFVFVQQNPPIEQPAQNPFIFHEDTCEGPGIREATRQQWEALKPLIQRIYMDEDKPFPYLAKILRDEYGFEPT